MPRILLVFSALLVWSITATAQPRVVASILPIHSLVAGVMQDVGEPELLMRGGTSPHDYHLRPSDVRILHQADIVFRVGHDLEPSLSRPLSNSSSHAVALMEADGLDLLPLREGGLWETHDHGHGHDHHGDRDAHLWLDPQRGAVMVQHIAAVLSEHDPQHAERYRANSETLIERLRALEDEIAEIVAPVRDVPYIVFHDAYQYFEVRFGTAAVGSIALNPERRPGARRVIDIRQRIAEQGAHCVFSEPQFEPALVETVIEGSTAHTGMLDPLGTELTPGPEAYFQLLGNMADALQDCLSRNASADFMPN